MFDKIKTQLVGTVPDRCRAVFPTIAGLRFSSGLEHELQRLGSGLHRKVVFTFGALARKQFLDMERVGPKRKVAVLKAEAGSQDCAKADAKSLFPDILPTEPHRYRIVVGRGSCTLGLLDLD